MNFLIRPIKPNVLNNCFPKCLPNCFTDCFLLLGCKNM